MLEYKYRLLDSKKRGDVMAHSANAIGSKIESIRKTRGISASYMAKRLGYKTVSGYLRYEQNADARLPLSLAKDIADILNVNITAFF